MEVRRGDDPCYSYLLLGSYFNGRLGEGSFERKGIGQLFGLGEFAAFVRRAAIIVAAALGSEAPLGSFIVVRVRSVRPIPWREVTLVPAVASSVISISPFCSVVPELPLLIPAFLLVAPVLASFTSIVRSEGSVLSVLSKVSAPVVALVVVILLAESIVSERVINN